MKGSHTRRTRSRQRHCLLNSESKAAKRPTRCGRYLALLRANRRRGRPPSARYWPDGLGWVELTEVQREAGAQHGARKQELKEHGYHIENAMIRGREGEVLSWYRLTYDPELDSAVKTPPVASSIPQPDRLTLTRGESKPPHLTEPAKAAATSDSLFPDAPERHLDLG